MTNFNLLEDLHVHSIFSDGRDSIETNLSVAKSRGLRRVGCVDHVRADTPWVGDYVQAVRRASRDLDIFAFAGLEAKILNDAGDLDVPKDLGGADFIYAADHQFPLAGRCASPREIRDGMLRGELSIPALIESLVRATMSALEKYPRIVIAHLFSILPKVGLTELQVTDAQLTALARSAQKHHAILEVDERWRCPSERTVRVFDAHDVPIVWSSDSHASDTIGEYRYNRALAALLGGS